MRMYQAVDTRFANCYDVLIEILSIRKRFYSILTIEYLQIKFSMIRTILGLCVGYLFLCYYLTNLILSNVSTRYINSSEFKKALTNIFSEEEISLH